MNFFDFIKVAFKNLSRQKSRTFLTIIAITVGSLSLILMASLIIGIRQSLMDEFRKLGAFNLITVTKDPNSTDTNNLMGTNGDPSEGKKITNVTLESMKKLDHVSDATPILSGIGLSTMRLEGSQKKTWANLVAFDPNTNVFEVPIVVGRKLQQGDLDKVVVGQRFIEELKYFGKEDELIGKKIILNSKMGGGGSSIDWGPAPEKPSIGADGSWGKQDGQNSGIDIEAEIVGVTSNGTVGDGSSYITMDWARKLNTSVNWKIDDQAMKKAQETCNRQNEDAKSVDKQTGKVSWSNEQECRVDNSQYMVLAKDDRFLTEGYTSIVLKVDDTSNLESVEKQVTASGFGAITAQTMINQINKMMMMIGMVLAFIAGISLFVASIGIINTMIMATYERTREIGVMRACGATRATIRRLFTMEAAALGFWGGVFGMVISVILGQIARLLISKFGATLGSIPTENIGEFPIWLIALVIAFTTLIGMISGLYPAIKAARLNPVDALRYE